jgi:hypothetical protein
MRLAPTAAIGSPQALINFKNVVNAVSEIAPNPRRTEEDRDITIGRDILGHPNFSSPLIQ